MSDKMAGKLLMSNITSARNQWYSKDSVFLTLYVMVQRKFPYLRRALDVISSGLSTRYFLRRFTNLCEKKEAIITCGQCPILNKMERSQEASSTWRKQQSRFYWSFYSVVMKNATPVTVPSACAVNCKQSMILENQKNITTYWLFVKSFDIFNLTSQHRS